MAGLTFNCKLQGLKPLLSKLGDPQVLEAAKVHLLRACGFVRDEAVIHAPWDSGHGRGSLTFELGKDMRSLTGVVGTPLKYMAYQEFGTGKLTDWPGGMKSGSKHALWPSGGLAPRKYLRNAFEAKKSAVQYEMQKTLNDVVSRLAK